MIEELSGDIWSDKRFRSEYSSLIGASFRKALKLPAETITADLIANQLQCASHFSLSKNHEYRDAAYRIAISSRNISNNHAYNSIIDVILSRLGNFPARNFLLKGQQSDVPAKLWFEIKSHEWKNSVATPLNGNPLVLTDFQRVLWGGLTRGISSGVSAPTSSGKSFALQNYLASRLANSKEFFGLYIVPTRALINQVSLGLIELFRPYFGNEILVSTVPVPPEEFGIKRGIYVLTQERLQVLNEVDSRPKFDVVIIDEAQAVGDGSRGIILQTVIEDLRNENEDIQFIFGCPNTDNVDIFSQLFNIKDLYSIKEKEIPVAQNLIYVETDLIDTKKVKIRASLSDQIIDIGSIGVNAALLENKSKIAYLSWFFGRNEKNLVYAGSPAACEKVAEMIADLIGDDFEITDDLKELSKFLKEHVHPDYLLAELVKVGVAFHYGNMPTIVRKTIEEFFQEGKLNFLVCTSTLLQGVNLPAKNIFLLDPSKGGEWGKGDEPITPIEFWNLAGRAGRLGKDFEGNIFLIDYSRWRSNPVGGVRSYQIESSFYNALTKNSSELIDFINKDYPSGKSLEIESAFVRLFNEYRMGNLEVIFGKLSHKMEKDVLQKITHGLEGINVSVPDEILRKHISISVYRQEEMYNYLIKRIQEKGPEYVIPLHPLQDWAKSRVSIQNMFRRIHIHFEAIKNNSECHYGPLALIWMRGESLPKLISNAFAYAKTKRKIQGDPSISVVIRDVIRDIEQEIRFRYVKYTRCYIDLLSEALRVTNNEDYISKIPSIPLYLELGASSHTMTSLIGLGLSRTAASEVAERAVNKEMNVKESMDWLIKKNWEQTDISRIIVREIRQITGKAK